MSLAEWVRNQKAIDAEDAVFTLTPQEKIEHAKRVARDARRRSIHRRFHTPCLHCGFCKQCEKLDALGFTGE